MDSEINKLEPQPKTNPAEIIRTLHNAICQDPIASLHYGKQVCLKACLNQFVKLLKMLTVISWNWDVTIGSHGWGSSIKTVIWWGLHDWILGHLLILWLIFASSSSRYFPSLFPHFIETEGSFGVCGGQWSIVQHHTYFQHFNAPSLVHSYCMSLTPLINNVTSRILLLFMFMNDFVILSRTVPGIR